MLHPKVLIPMWMVFAIPAISRRIALEFIHVTDMHGLPVFSLHISDIRRNSGKIRAALILMKTHRVNYGQAQLDNLDSSWYLKED